MMRHNAGGAGLEMLGGLTFVMGTLKKKKKLEKRSDLEPDLFLSDAPILRKKKNQTVPWQI